jgi:NB-ARC domain
MKIEGSVTAAIIGGFATIVAAVIALIGVLRRRKETESQGTTIITRTIELPPKDADSLHQLPPPLADFTGRDDEVKELRQLASSGGAVITGLKGSGGIGKTALALVLAKEWKDHFPDAQLVINLLGASDEPMPPETAMERIIHAWQPNAKLPEGLEELKGIYHTVLDGKRALLLLDNARDAKQVAPLLPPATCGLIITSRWSFTLPGMKTKDIGVLSPEEAANLLLTICDRIGDSAAAIAERCGYLPLALRLAASALKTRPMLTPAEYLERLRINRSKELDEAAASLRVSYDLLKPELQKLWRLLGIFPGSFDRAAATAVWANEKEASTQTLELLYETSMVEWDNSIDRYRLHDLARDFTLNLLHTQS